MLKRIINKTIRIIKLGEPPVAGDPGAQNLGIYWTPQMAEILETWGEDNAWLEIQLLLVNCRGKVLDIACGPGKVMQILSKFPQLELYGCDISDFFLGKAIERGLDQMRLKACDATDTKYDDKFFDYSYSIGSLEHFTEDGISMFLKEAERITKVASFHQIPVSLKGNEGWITPFQSYFNNSLEWWLPKFLAVFSEVQVLRSNWADGGRSIGQWLICRNSAS